MSLFATKPIESASAREISGEPVDPAQPLRRVLGALDLTMLGIGAIIGTGIFVLTGQAAAAHAGPAVVLSMIIAGLASALAAICYAEFASSVPVAGSAYFHRGHRSAADRISAGVVSIDTRAPVVHVGAVDRVDDSWAGDLFVVRKDAFLVKARGKRQKAKD